MNFNFNEAKVTWNDKEMPLHPRHHFNDNQLIQQVLTNEPHSTAEACANVIHNDAASKHEETNPQELTTHQVHSTPHQQQPLPQSLKKHARLFKGLDDEQLGMFPNRKHHIDLNLGAKAHCIKQPCSIPLTQQPAAKTEIKRQVDLGVVKKMSCH